MTAIAASAFIGRAIGRSSPATASITGPTKRSRRNIPRSPQAEFQRAVQYIAPDGRRASAAEASFLTLSHARGKGFWLALYKHAARLRGSLGMGLRLHRRAPVGLLPHQPASCGARTTSRRATSSSRSCSCGSLGLIYLAAFVSFAVQALGLIGSHGILPLARLHRCRRRCVSDRSASSWCRWCSG